MKYSTLGASGLQVSRICLGSATLGVAPLASDAARIVGHAIDCGINFFDTSNSYGHQPRFDRPGAPPAGERQSAEEILGSALSSHRDEIILATKVGEPVADGPNGRGLSRVHMVQQLDQSLRRLKTDHIDLYYAHVADPRTPIETTIRTFDEFVKQGKIRYYGLSRYSGSALIEGLWAADRLGVNPPVCFQLRYNLDDRSIESEILPAAERHGIAITSYSPLGGGLLAGTAAATRPISGGQRWGGAAFSETQLQIAAGMDQLSAKWGVPSAQLALAWLLSRRPVASAIIGAETVAELDESSAGADLELDTEQLDEIDALTRPAGRRP